MTDEAALLTAVAASVDDDTPRLVFADWLDDHGRPERAEFIRAQCRLARMSADDPELLPLHERQEQLLEKHRRDWLPSGWAFAPYPPEVWRRGFLTRLDMHGGRVAADETASLAAVPTLESFALGQVGMTDDEFARLPQLPNLKEFSLWGFDELTARSFARIAGWGALKDLQLLGAGLDDAGLAELGGMRGLRSLSVMDGENGWSVTDTGLAHLTGMTGLEELALGCEGVAGRGFENLSGLPRLRRLILGGCGLTEDALAPLAGCAGLEELDLNDWRDSGVSDRLLELLPGLPRLRVANTLRTGVTDRGFHALGQLVQLEELSVGGPNFGDAQLEALGGLKSLRRLHLSSVDVTPAGMAVLGRLTALRALQLTRAAVPDEFIGAITQLNRLRHLDLGTSDISDGRLARLGELPHLEVLCFRSPWVTDRGFAGLGPDTGLRHLIIEHTRATKEFVWDRRAEWAPQLETLSLNGQKYGHAEWVARSWRAV